MEGHGLPSCVSQSVRQLRGGQHDIGLPTNQQNTSEPNFCKLRRFTDRFSPTVHGKIIIGYKSRTTYTVFQRNVVKTAMARSHFFPLTFYVITKKLRRSKNCFSSSIIWFLRFSFIFPPNKILCYFMDNFGTCLNIFKYRRIYFRLLLTKT